MEVDKIKNLSILEIDKLKEFSENMILVYEENKELDDVKRWKDKLEIINEIIKSKLK